MVAVRECDFLHVWVRAFVSVEVKFSAIIFHASSGRSKSGGDGSLLWKVGGDVEFSLVISDVVSREIDVNGVSRGWEEWLGGRQMAGKRRVPCLARADNEVTEAIGSPLCALS